MDRQKKLRKNKPWEPSASFFWEKALGLSQILLRRRPSEDSPFFFFFKTTKNAHLSFCYVSHKRFEFLTQETKFRLSNILPPGVPPRGATSTCLKVCTAKVPEAGPWWRRNLLGLVLTLLPRTGTRSVPENKVLVKRFF